MSAFTEANRKAFNDLSSECEYVHPMLLMVVCLSLSSDAARHLLQELSRAT